MSVAVQAVVLVLVGFLQVVLGGLAVQLLFRIIDSRDRATTPDPNVATSLQAAGHHLRGGAWIGALERLAVYVTLLAGFPEGIAIVLAVKGLARYPELQASAGAAERFIIGTFASVLIAVAAAGGAKTLALLV